MPKNTLYGILKSMNLRKHILIIFFYSLITIGFTWPLILNLNKATPSIIPFYPQYKNMTDEYIAVWNTWQIKRAIESGENFFFTKKIFYPLGANLAIADHSLALSIMVLPIILLSNNPLIAYNFIVLLSFILSAYGAFLLIFYLTKNKQASFICGLIFSFSSARLAHVIASHQAVMSLQWIPLFFLFFIKIFRENRFLNYVWAGGFFLLTVLTSYYLSIFLILLGILWVILNINRTNLLKLIKFFLCTAIIHIPFLIILIKAFLQGYFPQGKGVFEMSYFYGADLLGFFVPAFFHSLFKNLVGGFYKNLSGNAWEHTTYIGYTVLFLVLFSLFKFKKNREVKKFAIMAFLFLILSLGAVLWIRGRPLMFGNRFIFMPQYVFKFIPILNNVRLPSRFVVLVSLCIILISGYGLKYILEKCKKKITITFLLSFLILLENLCLPFPLNQEFKIPLVYKEISQEKESFTILEVPFCVYSGAKILGYYYSPPQYYQIFHKKNILGGNLGRIPEFIYEYYQKLPFVSSIIKLQAGKKITNQERVLDQEYFLELVHFLNLKYIIIHKEFVGSIVHNYIESLIKDKVIKKEYPDGFILYKINKTDNSYPTRIDFSEKISNIYIIKGLKRYKTNPKTLWSQKHSTILFFIETLDDYKIKLTLLSLKPQELKLKVGKKKITLNLSKGTNSPEILIGKRYLNQGMNYINFIGKYPYSWGINSMEIRKNSSSSHR